MTVAKKLRQHIQTLPSGQAFSTASLSRFGLAENVRQALSRMSKQGELTRVSRGIFMRPKQTATMKNTMPSAMEIAKVATQTTGEQLATHGAEAVRKLGLSTQTPMQPIFYTTGNTRHIKVDKTVIKLKHICPRKIVAPGSIIELVISALWYLGKKNVTVETINKIKSRLSEEQIQNVLAHSEHMPAWMINSFHQHQ